MPHVGVYVVGACAILCIWGEQGWEILCVVACLMVM